MVEKGFRWEVPFKIPLKLIVEYGGGFIKGTSVIEYKVLKGGKLERKNKVVRSGCKSN